MVKTKGICESVVSLFVNLYSMNQLTYLSIQPCTYPLTHTHTHLPIHLPTHSFTHLTTYLSSQQLIYPSQLYTHSFITHLSIHLHTYLQIYPPTHPSTYLSIHLPTHPLTYRPPTQPSIHECFIPHPTTCVIDLHYPSVHPISIHY